MSKKTFTSAYRCTPEEKSKLERLCGVWGKKKSETINFAIEAAYQYLVEGQPYQEFIRPKNRKLAKRLNKRKKSLNYYLKEMGWQECKTYSSWPHKDKSLLDRLEILKGNGIDVLRELDILYKDRIKKLHPDTHKQEDYDKYNKQTQHLGECYLEAKKLLKYRGF